MGLLAAMAALALPAAGSGVVRPPEARPETVITLDKGQIYGDSWQLVAYRNQAGYWCEALVRMESVSSCTGGQPAPNPLLVTAAFHRTGPKPTTFAVISTTRKVTRVTFKLVPGDVQVTRRVESLPEGDRMRAGLPHGYRFVTIALDRVKGLRSIDAFNRSGKLVGHNDGISPPAQ